MRGNTTEGLKHNRNMADGLDALLDEVEAKFCRDISLSLRPPCTLKAEQHNNQQERKTDCVHRYKLQPTSANC